MSRKLFWAIIFTLVFSRNAYAVVAMDQSAIKEAQEYGMMHYNEELSVFAKPWCVYEDLSKAGDAFGEMAYIYTPYYLVAVNTRERMWGSQTINVVDGELQLRSYQGIFPVCLVIYLEDATNLREKISVSIKQGEKSAYAYDSEIQDINVVKTKVIKEQVFPEVNPAINTKDTDPTQTEKDPKLLSDDEKKAIEDKDDKDKKSKRRRSRRRKAAEQEKEKKQETLKPPVVTPPPVFVEKTVPALHRVNLFVYFESGHINLYGQTQIVVTLPKERERSFRFNFSSLY